MSNPLPRVSIVLSISESSIGLEHALAAIAAQTHPNVECFIVALNARDSIRATLARFHEKITPLENDSTDPISQLNRAFAMSRCEIMTWLDANERLFPWACERAANLFEQLPEIHWLTSTLDYQWTPDQFCVAGKTGLGYARATFLRGRHLPGAAAFQYPIRRAGTFWRRSLWEQTGGRINALLEDAGDFELWARFWNRAQLAACELPFGGRQAAVPNFMHTPRYFKAAQRALGRTLPTGSPYRLAETLRRQLTRRIPIFKDRWSSYPLYVLNTNMQEKFSARTIPMA